jgi:hypothetical protein
MPFEHDELTGSLDELGADHLAISQNDAHAGSSPA